MMAAHSLDHADGEVREGLLCPICLQDFHAIDQLQEHFAVAHTSEEPDVLHTFKDFLGKAKKKLLKQENDGFLKQFDNEESDITSRAAQETYWEPQQIGMTTPHTDYFRKIRGSRVDRYVIETNKLLIRLDKLITDAPLEPDKRKAQEKSIVHWVPDADVKLCPGCARSFNLSRRRHHCRLCGGIMCHDCSQFLDFSYARKLTYPSMSRESPITSIPHSNSLHRRGSSTSLLSIVSPTGEPHIRICRDCMALLNRRDQQVEKQTSKPVIAQLYEKMREQISEAEKLIPVYCKMADSISAGETRYHLRDAQELHMKLKRLAEGIDLISRKVATLGTQEEAPPSPKVLQLQGGIRMSASYFLRNVMMSLPNIPSAEEVVKLQEAHRQKVQMRIQHEKQAAFEAEQRTQQKSHKREPSVNSVASTSPKENYQDIVLADTGWTANAPEKSVSANEDPMIQQMDIIRNYIKQAQLDHKYDEVQMLEANLRELQLEYMKHVKDD